MANGFDAKAYLEVAGSEPETPTPSFSDAPLDFAGSMPGPRIESKTEFELRNKIYDPTKSIAKVNYSHDAMIDLIIANPGLNQGELARTFGYTEGWVSQVMSSDAFKERLAERKKQLVDPSIVASIEERFEAVARLSLERLKEKLERSAAPTLDTIMAGANLASRALGYGARPDPRAQVNVAVQTVVHVPAKARDSDEWQAQRTLVVPK